MQSAREPHLLLQSKIVEASAASNALVRELFELFSKYFGDISPERFASDLSRKTFLILLECEERVVGFTSAELFPFSWRGEVITVLFSGDTIVDRDFWGEQELGRAWLDQVGRLAALRPALGRLVWFLIVKGHRTYRYLPVFARSYVPAEATAADKELLDLRNAIATARFGDSFDPQTGVIHFAEPQGRLLQSWAEPTAREARLPAVSYFLSANPGFRDGDELACLCDLSPQNMRPRARRWFDEGFVGG